MPALATARLPAPYLITFPSRLTRNSNLSLPVGMSNPSITAIHSPDAGFLTTAPWLGHRHRIAIMAREDSNGCVVVYHLQKREPSSNERNEGARSSRGAPSEGSWRAYGCSLQELFGERRRRKLAGNCGEGWRHEASGVTPPPTRVSSLRHTF